ERIGPLADGAGAQAHDDVAGLDQGLYERRQLIGIVDGVDGAMAAGVETFGKCGVSGAFDRLFTRRVDGGYDHRIRIVKTRAELVEKTRETRVAVRLHDGHDLGLRHPSR